MSENDLSTNLGGTEPQFINILHKASNVLENILIPRTIEKINQVIDMIEHPERYAEAQVEHILQDEDCGQTYLTMMEIRMAFVKEDEEKKLNVEQEWQNLISRQKPIRLHFTWSMIAAYLVAVLLLSGIAVAAIHIISASRHETEK